MTQQQRQRSVATVLSKCSLAFESTLCPVLRVKSHAPSLQPVASSTSSRCFPAVKGTSCPSCGGTKLSSSPEACGPCNEGSKGPTAREHGSSPGLPQPPERQGQATGLLEKVRLPGQVEQDYWTYGDLLLVACDSQRHKSWQHQPAEENPSHWLEAPCPAAWPGSWLGPGW